jgi:hypothetical protein
MGAADRRRSRRRGAANATGRRGPILAWGCGADRAHPRSAGFDDVRFEDVHEPVFYGPDVDTGLAVVTGFQNTSAALASLSDCEAARTVERLRGMLAAHHSHEHGVVLDSRSWLITAQRRR